MSARNIPHDQLYHIDEIKIIFYGKTRKLKHKNPSSVYCAAALTRPP